MAGGFACRLVGGRRQKVQPAARRSLAGPLADPCGLRLGTAMSKGKDTTPQDVRARRSAEALRRI